MNRGKQLTGAALALIMFGALITLVSAKAVKKPDLVVTEVTAVNTRQGNLMPLSDTVKNKGKKTAKASETGYFLSADEIKGGSDVQIGETRPVPSLKKRKSSQSSAFTAEIPLSVETGDYFVIACADVEGQVNEKKESNNCRATDDQIAIIDGIPPSLTLDSLTSPSSDETPTLTGDAEPDSTVSLYTSNDCTGPVADTDVASPFGEFALTTTVTENATTILTVQATDAAFNDSPCTSPVSYVEDSTDPAEPTGLATNPVSPANDTTPHVTGNAEAGSTVSLYTTGGCTGPPIATGTATGGTFDIEVTVPEGSVTTFVAQATDSAGNTSDCSGTFVTYTEQGEFGEAEPNDTIANADTQTTNFPALGIGGDKRISAAIDPPSDEDVFKITAAAGQVVRFETLNGAGTDCDPGVGTILDLRDSVGTSLTSDTAGGLRSCSALTRAIPAGGAYVRVVDDGANGFIPSYQLRAEFFSDGGSESEPNDTPGSADPVGNQAFVTGSFITDSEADVYSFTVPEGASVRLETIEAAVGNPNFETCESNDMDTIIDLLDSAGNVMATDDDGGRGRCSMIDGRGGAPNSYPPLNAPLASNLDAGTYYVRVIPYDGGFVSAFDYRLAVSIE